MLNFFGRRKNRQPTPPWVTWMVILFVLYAFASNMSRERYPDGSPVRESLEKASQELSPSQLIDFAAYKDKIFPKGASLRVQDVTPGKGNPAICGQKVSVAYAAFKEGDIPVNDKATKDKPLIFRIGEGKAMPALEQGVIGLQPGGTRSLIAKPSLAYDSDGHAREDVPKDTMIRFELELLDASPALPDIETTPYRLFDNTFGQGTAILCGQPANVRLTVWGTGGKKLYASDKGKPLRFTPGRSEVFLGLEQGVIGMREGGIRTMIVPPDFQKTMHGDAPVVDIPFPKGETVIVEVEALKTP